MKPGWKTSEFWISLIVVIAGAVMAVYPQESQAFKIAGIAMSTLTALGYTTVRGGVKKAAKLLLVVAILGAVAGCTQGMIRADAIDGSIDLVTKRHDAMLLGKLDPKDLNGDGKVDEKDEADRRTYLRTSELLRYTVGQAKE